MNDSQPPLSLRELCFEIISFLRHLLDRRANLAAPGYHLDLDASKAAATAEFLCSLPPLCSALAGKIVAYHQANGTKEFEAHLVALRDLHDKPQLVFSLRARAIHEHYFVSEELFAAIIAPPEEDEEALPFMGGEI